MHMYYKTENNKVQNCKEFEDFCTKQETTAMYIGTHNIEITDVQKHT